MKTSWCLGLTSLLGSGALGLWLTGMLPFAGAEVAAQQPAPPVNPAKAIRPLIDRRKSEIEGSTERLIAQLREHQEKEAAARAAARFENPAVEPGKVRWHASFDEACKAAQRSGKPVLLFQLLGQLDQRFT